MISTRFDATIAEIRIGVGYSCVGRFFPAAWQFRRSWGGGRTNRTKRGTGVLETRRPWESLGIATLEIGIILVNGDDRGFRKVAWGMRFVSRGLIWNVCWVWGILAKQSKSDHDARGMLA